MSGETPRADGRRLDAPALTVCGHGSKKADDAERDEFMRVFTRHVALEMLTTRFSSSLQALRADIPQSPFQGYLDSRYSPLPVSITRAADYRALVSAMLELGAMAIAEFRELGDPSGARE